jgi:hypothetical protein
MLFCLFYVLMVRLAGVLSMLEALPCSQIPQVEIIEKTNLGPQACCLTNMTVLQNVHKCGVERLLLPVHSVHPQGLEAAFTNSSQLCFAIEQVDVQRVEK